MSDEENTTIKVSTETAAPSEHTTDPQDELTSEQQETRAVIWEMPKPVFQQTSGYLPQGYLKEIEAGTGKSIEESLAPSLLTEEPNLTAQAEPVAYIEPNRDKSENLLMENFVPDTPAAAPAKTGSVRIPIIILSVLGILAFLTIFFLALWFLFLAEPGAGNNF